MVRADVYCWGGGGDKGFEALSLPFLNTLSVRPPNNYGHWGKAGVIITIVILRKFYMQEFSTVISYLCYVHLADRIYVPFEISPNFFRSLHFYKNNQGKSEVN